MIQTRSNEGAAWAETRSGGGSIRLPTSAFMTIFSTSA